MLSPRFSRTRPDVQGTRTLEEDGVMQSREAPSVVDLTGTAEGVQQLYRHRFSERDRRKKDFVWRTIVADFLQGWVAPNDVVLDVGCGQGEFLNHVQCRHRIGIDPNVDPAPRARGRDRIPRG